MRRLSVARLRLKAVVECRRIFPVENRDMRLLDLKAFGLVLGPEQAIRLARNLLVAACEWREVDLTAFRRPRKDGSYPITVTTAKP